MDPALRDIRKKTEDGVRLSDADALALYRSADILSIGEMAAAVTEKKNGRRAYYVVNCHINPTNVCVNMCALCAFSRSPGQEGAYRLSMDDILARAGQAAAGGATEFHIVGGLHPDMTFDDYLGIVDGLHTAFPHVLLKAFTAVEIEYLSRLSGLPVEGVLRTLRDSGVTSLPGGGAEIFDPAVRAIVCASKISGDAWLSIMETAHGLGISTTATMLYGHVETLEHRVAHLARLRALQDRTGGFLCFIPLAFHPANTRLANTGETTGYDDLKTVAISRLFLDNVPHIKAYWVMLGEKLAQVALLFGADDMDGTVREERIAHEAGAQSPVGLTEADLIHLITAAGKIPVKRDSVYTVLPRSA